VKTLARHGKGDIRCDNVCAASMTTVPGGKLVEKRTICRCSSAGKLALAAASSNGRPRFATGASNAPGLLDAPESGAAETEANQKAAARTLAAFSADILMFMISPVRGGQVLLSENVPVPLYFQPRYFKKRAFNILMTSFHCSSSP
jgi:hypothetical protein